LDFEVAIGGLVSAIKRQDDTLFQKLLEKTRAEVMGVLSAASMESYQRAYPYITKLHMLHGTATSVITLAIEPSSSATGNILLCGMREQSWSRVSASARRVMA
jgi:hypothetical protein